jgi:hypothetical protein
MGTNASEHLLELPKREHTETLQKFGTMYILHDVSSRHTVLFGFHPSNVKTSATTTAKQIFLFEDSNILGYEALSLGEWFSTFRTIKGQALQEIQKIKAPREDFKFRKNIFT